MNNYESITFSFHFLFDACILLVWKSHTDLSCIPVHRFVAFVL
uniref:Uncharacterized protein n=1 Tax=Arundo donax TaxID=35708 RepID=A0A0A9HPX7_ARUDO